MIILVVCLVIVLVCTLFYLRGLKKDLRKLKTMLIKINQIDTNMRLTTTTFDRNVTGLAVVINELLDKQNQVELEKEQTNRAFRQGITNISHDLRTPLTSAKGYIGLLKSCKDEQKVKSYLEIVEGRLESLSHLMNQLFDYSQIIEGKTITNLESIDVCKIIKEELISFYDPLASGGFRVTVDLPEEGVRLIADVDQLKRVINNLVSNVIKHGIDFFAIKVTQNGKIRFSNKVKDPKKLDATLIFERFYTVDTARNNEQTGLGLPIVKGLIDQMNGHLKADLNEEILTIEIGLQQLYTINELK